MAKRKGLKSIKGSNVTCRKTRKPKGILWKRAEASLPLLYTNQYSNYDKGYVIGVSKNHLNYFMARLHDINEDRWADVTCAYIDKGMVRYDHGYCIWYFRWDDGKPQVIGRYRTKEAMQTKLREIYSSNVYDETELQTIMVEPNYDFMLPY